METSNADAIPCMRDGIKRKEGRMDNADIDFCGAVLLLDWLLANGELDEREHQNLQKRLRRQMGAGIILISEQEK